jgi:hypothetical protein
MEMAFAPTAGANGVDPDEPAPIVQAMNALASAATASVTTAVVRTIYCALSGPPVKRVPVAAARAKRYQPELRTDDVGEFATTVQSYLKRALEERCLSVAWETEASVAGTRVDIAGDGGGERYLVELEWRRADPADNTAKLFRHLESGAFDTERVAVFQLFTGYYDLQRGGVSSKRRNAEFVGQVAAETVDRLSYTSVELGLDPPKRGGPWPADWKTAANAVADVLRDQITGDIS